MDDLISRQAAIDEVQRHRENVLGGYEYDEGVAFVYAAAHNHIIEVIKCIPSAQKWIPCSERLPDDGETVLVTRDDGTCKIATFEVGEIENGWQMDSWYTEDNVTAWMPLPEPYKEGRK